MHRPGGSHPSPDQDQMLQSLVHSYPVTVHPAQSSLMHHHVANRGKSSQEQQRKVPAPDRVGTRLTGPIPDVCLVRSKAQLTKAIGPEPRIPCSYHMSKSILYFMNPFKEPTLASDEHHSTCTGSLVHNIQRPSILVREHRYLGIMHLGFQSNS